MLRCSLATAAGGGKRERDKGENRERREQRICEEQRPCFRVGNEKSLPRGHIVKPEKTSWLRAPEISRFRGLFSRFLAFFAAMRFADIECRKKYIISKNGFGRDVEQLSPAAKAQYLFLRAESALSCLTKLLRLLPL